MDYASITTDDFIVETNSRSEADLRADFGLEPVEEKAPTTDAPEKTAIAEPEPAMAEKEAPAEDGEPDEKAAKERDEAGRFKAKKPRNDPQARIDEITAKHRQAERERDAERARVAALEAEVARYRQPQPPAPPQTPAVPSHAQYRVEPTRVMPKEEEVGSKYPTYGDYMSDLARWHGEQLFAEQAQTQREQARGHSFQARLAQARQQIPDFDQQLRGDLPITKDMAEAIQDSPVSPLLLLHFSHHPEDAQRLSTLPPAVVSREMGRLEAWLIAAMRQQQQGAPAPVVQPAVSHAKPPIKPVGSSPPAADPHEITDDLSVEEHIRRMNARDRKARLR